MNKQFKKQLLLSVICVSISGCGILDRLSSDNKLGGVINSKEPHVFVIGAPAAANYGDPAPNGVLGVISPSGNAYTVDKSYLTIAKTANDAEINNGLLYVLNTGSSSLLAIDTVTKEKTETSLGAGNNPNEFIIYKGFAYVTNRTAHSVSVVDLSKTVDAVSATIKLPAGPDLFPFDGETTFAFPQGITVVDDLIYVALTNQNSDSQPAGPSLVAVIDPRTHKITRTIRLSYSNVVSLYAHDKHPNRLFALQAGKTWPENYHSVLEVIDTDSYKIVGSASIGSDSFQCAFNDEGTIYVLSGWGALSVQPLTFENDLFTKSELVLLTSNYSGPSDIVFDDDNTMFVSDLLNSVVYILKDGDSEVLKVNVNKSPQVLVFDD